jgi:CcmD family protein
MKWNGMENKLSRHFFCIITLSLMTLTVRAQNEGGVDMADTMRSEGKIYVVVLIVAIVFTGLIIFAILSDRKISKLEKEIKSLKSKEDL